MPCDSFVSVDEGAQHHQLQQEEGLLSIPDLKVSCFWLRDHCRCDKCYNHSTNQRKISIRSIPLDIRAASAKVTGDQLTVTCEY